MTAPQVKDAKYFIGKKYDGMMGRCYRETDSCYKNYGKRNVRVCADWIESIERFRWWFLLEMDRSDIALEAFEKSPGKYVLDRIDTKGHYTPETCRIVSPQQNLRNQRNKTMKTITSSEGRKINIGMSVCTMIFVFMLAGIANASQKHRGHYKHHDPIVVHGEKGEKGDPGESVVGPIGPRGSVGSPGVAGVDADANTFKARVGADVIWQDWDNAYLSSGYRYDTINDGHLIDMVVLGIKIGKSSEDRKIEKLEKQIQELQARLGP